MRSWSSITLVSPKMVSFIVDKNLLLNNFLKLSFALYSIDIKNDNRFFNSKVIESYLFMLLTTA